MFAIRLFLRLAIPAICCLPFRLPDLRGIFLSYEICFIGILLEVCHLFPLSPTLLFVSFYYFHFYYFFLGIFYLFVEFSPFEGEYHAEYSVQHKGYPDEEEDEYPSECRSLPVSSG